LGVAAANLVQDFGYAGSGSIGDTVWFDRNDNGAHDVDDDGIPGVTITLTWRGPDHVAGGGDDVAFTRTTDAAGHYLFAHLPSGNYDVAASGLPPFYVNTFDEDLNRDADVAVALTIGADHLTADFGYNGATAIGDRVWWDINADGVQDAGEPGIAGVDVTITFAGPNNVFGDGDDLLFNTTTDAQGNYLVTNTPQGDYTVAIAGGVPTGMTATYDEDSGATAPDESTAVALGVVPHLTADFGYVGSGAIGDLIYLDLDGNGALSAGDQGLANIGVRLTWAGSDGTFGTPDDILLDTTTDATGAYRFTGLPAGAFRVNVDDNDLPPGLDPTADPDGGDDQTSALTLATGETNALQDFGYNGIGSIGDTVWLDNNGNGTIDAGEPGLPDVGITMVWAGVDKTFGTPDDVTSTTTTDHAGNYLFTARPAGQYRVTVNTADLPTGVAPTHDADGGADHTSTLTLAVAGNDHEQDFGYRGSASIGDRVWFDVNHNAKQDTNEPPYEGLVVTVTAAGLDATFGTTDDIVFEVTTDAHGRYLATGLPAGDVRVSYDRGDMDAGEVPGSDFDGGDATTTARTLVNGDAPRNVDFGIVGDASLAGVVWRDIDADGKRDPGEVGIPGVTVTAVWAGPNGPVTLTVVTRPNGTWSFDELPAGSYTVTVAQSTVPTNLVPTTPVSVVVVVPAGRRVAVHHGETPGASIGDHVWLDSNRNGVFDAGEVGIAGVTIRLESNTGGTIATVVTDGAGEYVFDDLVPGDYRVVVATETLPADYVQYADPDGTLDAQSAVSVVAGEHNVMQNFAFGPAARFLPRTGANLWIGLALGLVSLGSGALVLIGTRRRRYR
jgi:large repetitive protein